MYINLVSVLILLIMAWFLMFFRKKIACFLANHPIIIKIMLIICLILMIALAILPMIFILIY